MFQIGTSNAAQTLMLRRNGHDLKNSVAQLTEQLSSGQKSDKARAVHGELGPLSEIEYGISLSERRIANAGFLSTILSAQQTALSRLSGLTQDLALDLQTSTNSATDAALAEAASRARNGFEDAIGLLNTRTAGRYLFSGVAGQVRPFAEPQTILDALATSLPAGASGYDIKNHVEAWFEPGGGFDVIAYQGGGYGSAGIEINVGVEVRMEISGSEQAFRESLAGIAMAALGDTLASSLASNQKRALLNLGSLALFDADASRVALEARVGATEERVEIAKLELASRNAVYQIARNDLLAADPYDTAIALEAATQRLDALFTVTARLSRLSLTEYLR